MTFFARHLLATFVTIAVPCVFWTIVYFALLVWSLVAGGGIGSPVAYPVGMVLLVLLAVVVSFALFLPSTVIAERLVRARGLPGWAQIPISIGTLAIFCLVLSGVAAVAGFTDRTFRTGGTIFLAALVPMGLYWWTAQSGPMVISLLRRLRLIR